MFNERYCCFAIPLYGVGIYAILAQFTIIGVLAGVLALAAPAILAIAVPSFMTVIFGILCILVGALQLWGFWGVYREKALSFRKYVSVNIGLIGLTILYTLAVIILSATRHTQAVDSCVTQFIYNANNSTGTANGNGVISGQKLCNIWTWAQLGVCGLLFLLVAASEVYFCLMERVWASDQRRDHAKYRSIVSAARESYAMRPSGDWDSTSRQGSLDDQELRPTASQLNKQPGDLRNAPATASRLRNEVDWDSKSAARAGTGGVQASTIGSAYSGTHAGTPYAGHGGDAYGGGYGGYGGDALAEEGYDYPRGGSAEHAGYGRDDAPVKSSGRQQYYGQDGGMLRKQRPY